MTTELDYRSLTTGEVAGSGLYDELSRTTCAHIQQEYKEGRLSGTDYSRVLVASLGSNLQMAVQYLVQYPITNQQVKLMQSQTEAQEKQNEMLDLQRESLVLQNDAARYGLDIMMPEQLKQLQTQNAVMSEQLKGAVLNNILLNNQIELGELNKILAEENIKNTIAQNTDPTGGLLKAQFDKTQAELSVMAQKLKTEQAQTMTSIDGVKVGGLIGADALVKTKQAEAFDRSAEVSAAKIYADAWSLGFSTEPKDLEPNRFGFSMKNSQSIMKTLFTGINADWDQNSTDKIPKSEEKS